MEKINNCPLCYANDESDVISIGKRVLYRGKYIYVAVDIAPLTLGHLLIITNDHYFNFYETSKEIKEETIKVKEIIQRLFQEIYHKETIFFEHGSTKSGEAGASIDHAHLHVMPCNFNIKENLDTLLGQSISCDILKEQFSNEFSYIYLEDSNHNVIYKVEKLPSQYLRKLVGEKLENTNYDWHINSKKTDSLNLLEQTYNDLKDKTK